MKFTYSIPTKILFGPGSFNDFATTPLPGGKALIVITAGKSMRANGYLDRLIAILDKQGIGHALFDKILSNSVLRHVHEGAVLAREQGCDSVIGLGGGSSIDFAPHHGGHGQRSGCKRAYLVGKPRSKAMNDVMTFEDGYKAVIAYDPETEIFRANLSD